MTNAQPDQQSIHTLHRYFVWSILLKDQFDANADKDIERFGYMSYWYASLWVVVEGWVTLGLHDAEVDALLASPNAEGLKLYRHYVFHFHDNYWNPSLTMPLIEGQDSATWVRALSNAFGRAILEHLGKL